MGAAGLQVRMQTCTLGTKHQRRRQRPVEIPVGNRGISLSRIGHKGGHHLHTQGHQLLQFLLKL